MSRLKRQRLTSAGHDKVTAETDEDGVLQDQDQDPESPHTPRAGQTKPPAPRRSLFVRSLPASATTESLIEFFSQSYPLKHATVVLDKATRQPKGFGFITFADVEDAKNARKEFNGASFDGKRIEVDFAEPRRRHDIEDESRRAVASTSETSRQPRHAQPPLKLIVRNLPWTVGTDEQLGKLFMSYGKIKRVHVPKRGAGLSAGFGFVELRGRKNAERALAAVNGKEIDGRTLAVDWAVEKGVWETLQQAKEEEEEEERDSEEPAESVESENEAEVNVSEVSLSEEMDGEESGSGDEEDLVKEDNEKDGLHVTQNRGATNNGSTIFVRNIPFTVTDEILSEHFASFWPVRYARVVVDKATERSKGTGFVCFYNVEDAKACMREAPRSHITHPSPGATGKGNNAGLLKQSLLEDTTVDRTGRFTLEGRVLQISHALDRTEASRLAFTNKTLRDSRDRDRRHLYLLSEGTVPSDSPVYQKLSPSEIKMREDSARQRQTLIKSNPSLHLSLTRLSVRNMPRSVTSKDLKRLAREAVVGFAKDVKNASRKQLSKEELSREGEEMRLAEKERKAKGKGIVKQAKVVFEGKDGAKVTEESGAGRSRGYGFIEYSSHRWALMGLRWLNGHAVEPSQLNQDSGVPASRLKEGKKRLIVEFAIENAEVVLQRKQREIKASERSKFVSEQRKLGTRLEKKREPTKDQVMARIRKGTSTKRKRPDELSKWKEAAPDMPLNQEDSKDVEKAAKRAKIIGRKRMSRKARHRTKERNP
ncbi:MAG: hypothetical protein Q9163_006054 [Psora crenata]